jgi:hypothetical protein
VAEVLVKKELRNKVLISDWTSKFLSNTDDVMLDPVTFGFTRFSLNVALCFNDVTPEYLLHNDIHKVLISLIGYDSELVVGPALLALYHISLHEAMKFPIVVAHALPALLKLLNKTESQLLLTLGSKLLASLALQMANKPLIATSGCFHVLVDIFANAKRHNQDATRDAAVCATINIVHGNDGNRTLSVELNALHPLIQVLKFCDSEVLLWHAIQALINITYLNSFSASRVLIEGGDACLVELLQSSDVLRQTRLVGLVLACLSNMCNSITNQAHICASADVVEMALRVVESAR